MECPGRFDHLDPSHSRDLEAQGAFLTKDGPLGTRRHQLHLGCMRPRPYGHSHPLDAISRHILELPADPVPLEHGGLRRSNDLVGPGNLSIVPKV